MMHRILRISSFLLVFTFLACTQQSKVDNKPQSFQYDADCTDAFYVERLNLIDSVYQSLVEDNYLPNAVVFVAHGGRVVYHKAFGWRNKEMAEPCRKDDIFRIASQTKAITAVALMTLWEEGRFQLDDPIKKYIPAFDHPQVLVTYDAATGAYTTRPANCDITIRHLLTHTSGLSYQGFFWDIAEKAGVPPLNSLDSITLAQMVERMATLPLAHDPGAAFTYSMNIDVLGRLIEILSGMPIDRFLQKRIFEPLQMNDTYFYLPSDKVERLVTLYAYDSEAHKLYPSEHPIYQFFPYKGAKMLMSTGAGLCGTIEDYAKFCQMILNGGTFNHQRIIGRKTLEMMQRNAVGDMRGDIGFGLAWDVFRPQYLHNTILSEGTMRWGGMFSTDYVIDPQEDLIVLFYTNIYPNTTGVNPKVLLHNLVYQALK